jgi:dipeptidyl aminopeptidase/acylaminoacyl peptidase
MLLWCLTLCAAGAHASSAPEPRVLAPDDYYHFVEVSDPQLSPDGSTVAYVVTRNDRESDAAKGAIWLVDWDGADGHPLTQGETASDPRFSPDGRYVSFLSARPEGSASQVWLLDRHGGEARQLTHARGKISSYAWAPDGKRLVLVMSAEDPRGDKAPQPIVIDGFRFKADEQGYLNARTQKHLELVDVADGTDTVLTTDAGFDDDHAAWSPDGTLIAYVSNHRTDAEQSGVDEIYLIEPRARAAPRKLAAVYSPNNQRLSFSPDGRFVAFLQGRQPRYNAYIADRLALAAVADGRVRPLTDALDQQVSSPVFEADGSAVAFLVEDHGAAYEARADLATGRIARATTGSITVLGNSTAAGRTVLVGSTDTHLPELFALESGALRPLTAHNDAALSGLTLGSVEDILFKSRDGTEIQGQLVKPPSYIGGRRYPTIVWLHGGPNGQDQHELISSGYSPSLERQLLAAQGYLVLAVNYRGSTGRGEKFQQSIIADWGHKEVEDVLAAVDYAVSRGLADPAKLGIGGWSYGGILTDYTIASDPRFKAAISGAGSGDQLGMFGLDQYALQYAAELGPPWRETALYLKLSYPFLHADRIHTPTLFIGGDKDFNVPIAGSEQMYLALRMQHVPSELVVYPGEYHVFTRPSFLKDRAERYIAWFAKYL